MLLTVEYIDPADLLEKHKAPPYSSQDSNWRDATSIPSYPTYSKIRQAVPKGFNVMIIYRSLAVASPPYNAVDSDIQP